jgi:DNA-binding PadR family transcriptional regulator
MSLRHGILGLLAVKPMAGYDLMKIFNKSIRFFWPAQTSQIYRELDAMDAEGLIHEEEERQRGHLVKTIYAISPKGSEELARWLGDSGVKPSPARNPFLLRLFFQAAGGTDSVRTLVVAKKNQAEANMAELREILAGVIPEYSGAAQSQLEILCWSQTVEFGLAQYEAEVRWAEAFLSKLDARKGKNYEEDTASER